MQIAVLTPWAGVGPITILFLALDFTRV
jgi:hypothetical protein